jgi:predicted nucleotidyltransferase
MAQITSEVLGSIKKYVQALQKNGVRVQQVFLYGSHAKSKAHLDSDIDIIIVSESFTGKHLFERLEMLGDARWNIREPIQAYGFTPEEVETREDLTAFWDEIIETEAIPITEQILK